MPKNDVKTLDALIEMIDDVIKDTNDVLYKVVGPVLKDDENESVCCHSGTIDILEDKLCILLERAKDSAIMAKYLDDKLD